MEISDDKTQEGTQESPKNEVTQSEVIVTPQQRQKKIKHKRVANKILKGKNPVAAYQSVYPQARESTAISEVSRLLSSEEIKKYMSDQLDKQGLGIIALNKKLRPLTESPMKAISGKYGIEYVPDNAIKLAAIQEGYRLHKLTDAVKQDNRKVIVNIIDSPEKIKSLEGITDKLDNLYSQLTNSAITGEIIETSASATTD